jgi:taurine dioxygenase
MTFHVESLSNALGQTVSNIDLRVPLSATEVATLQDLLHNHCVLHFPKQSLSEPEQLAFGRQFGELNRRISNYQIESDPHVMYITNEKANGEYVGALPDGEMFFHTDTCYLREPVMGSVLYAMSIPKQGGDTLFANLYKAYEELHEGLKQQLEGLFVENCFDPGKSDYATPRAQQQYRSETELSCLQPVVLKHPVTGRKALYVNRGMSRCIDGFDAEASNALLTTLFDHQEQDHLVYRHRWSLGDVIMWDNRCTVHARSHFDNTELRKMRRVTVKGVALY